MKRSAGCASTISLRSSASPWPRPLSQAPAAVRLWRTGAHRPRGVHDRRQSKYSDHSIGQAENRPPARLILVGSIMFTARSDAGYGALPSPVPAPAPRRDPALRRRAEHRQPGQRRAPPPPWVRSWIRPALCIGTGLALGGRLDRYCPWPPGWSCSRPASFPVPCPRRWRARCGRCSPAWFAKPWRGSSCRCARSTDHVGTGRAAEAAQADRLGRLHPGALLGSLSADAPPALAGAMARYGLLSHRQPQHGQPSPQATPAGPASAPTLARRLATSDHQVFRAAL